MAVMNGIDRFHLALAAIGRVSGIGAKVHGFVARIESMLETHRAHVREHGEDMPAIRDWQWRGPFSC
jgi:xylulose-5-phosphate/fructose-6-phosphate phosphoketolase